MPGGYAGTTARTRTESKVFACACGERFAVHLVRAVDATEDPELAATLLAGRLNHARCGACGTEWAVQVSVVYHDAAAERLALCLPDGLRHRELEERALLYRRLADDAVPAPRYVRELSVVFGAEGLRQLIDEAPPAGSPGPSASLGSPRSPGSPGSVAPAEAAQAASPRAAMAMPDARSAAVERWLANRDGPAVMLCDDHVVLCAAISDADRAAFAGAPLEVRLQLHRMPSYPVLAITLLAGGRRGAVVHALIELQRAAHRAVLERLGKQFSVEVELFDAELRSLRSAEVAAPLEENLRRLYAAAKQALQHIAPSGRSFERARAGFFAPAHERLGRVEVTLSAEELGSLDGARAVRQAVAQVAHWSEPAAEGYLVEIRSFPLPSLRAVRAEVVWRAADLGIHVPRRLAESVAEELGFAWPELLRRQVQAFAALVLSDRGSGLPPESEAENWRLLFDECRAAEVPVDPMARELAEGRTLPRFRKEEVEDLPSLDDLRGMHASGLLALLERRDVRRDAALALCERREPGAVDPIFAALLRMTRADANRVLPAVVLAYGDAAEAPLVGLLRARRSYLRQGAALALGALAAANAAEPMARLLVEEPTEIWREVARAVGDLGAPAIEPLLGRLALARSDARERLVRALAHVARQAGPAPLEELVAGPTPHFREAARRALTLEQEVRRGDAEVRGGSSSDGGDQTAVRAFSRRFFELLGGTLELSEADLEELRDRPADPPELEDDGGDAPRIDPLLRSRRDEVTHPMSSLPRERVP